MALKQQKESIALISKTKTILHMHHTFLHISLLLLLERETF